MVTNDLLWMRINPLCRYEQFLTNELELESSSMAIQPAT
uniref:Transposase n=1 Tax=Heterorhabditis bacteriophora TaxID=37862 RepID=A0A1I7XJN2_HETBA